MVYIDLGDIDIIRIYDETGEGDGTSPADGRPSRNMPVYVVDYKDFKEAKLPLQVRSILSEDTKEERRLVIDVEAEDWYQFLNKDTKFNGFYVYNLESKTSIHVIAMVHSEEFSDCHVYKGHAELGTGSILDVYLTCYNNFSYHSDDIDNGLYP